MSTSSTRAVLACVLVIKVYSLWFTYSPASSSTAWAVNTAVPEGCFSFTVSRYRILVNLGLLSFTSATFTRTVAIADCLGTPVSVARTW